MEENSDTMRSLVWKALANVFDPEMPGISVVDLGMIHAVEASEVQITIVALPTFIGCPALPLMEKEMTEAVGSATGVRDFQVVFRYDPPWSSSRITADGRRKLRGYGIAPPADRVEADGSFKVACPYCDSMATVQENGFGPTACRSIMYCKQCKNPFEAIKPI